MKKTLLTLLVIAPMAISLTGCIVAVGGEDGHSFSTEFGDREYKNREIIANMPLNSSYGDVSQKLGVADFNEAYQQGDDSVQVLYYRTHRVHKDGLTTKDECTYLNFVNGRLVESGNGGEYTRNMNN